MLKIRTKCFLTKYGEYKIVYSPILDSLPTIPAAVVIPQTFSSKSSLVKYSEEETKDNLRALVA